MGSSVWHEYFEKTKSGPPRPLLVEALSHIPQPGKALDLGAGAGNDTAYLLEEGFMVTAVDSDSNSEKLVKTSPGQKNLNFARSSFEDFTFGKYDLINAQFSLPFNPSETFIEFIFKIKDSLRPGGIFVGQLFGTKDGWNIPGTKLTFHKKEDAMELLKGLEVLEFKEEEYDGLTAIGGQKHWHIFNIIARKPNKIKPIKTA